MMSASSGLTGISEAKDYNPLDGIHIYFDYITRMYYLFEEVRLVFSIHL